ncbi:HNH endonuclease [Bacillus cereus]|uniref:HNH endonuclease n=1 Tax=Bacillus cereus TaxID=1396 RepID=UPI000BF682DA|nr:HNH endonuclease signature motif containing protein [Bacillus cereus]PFC67953.1 HNH endonuclease [Bacillus cereus]PFJ19585.1 HNH endonuclease [Bacillus cereus]PGX46187.1 HNH endonuclease [Bacillus cereus]
MVAEIQKDNRLKFRKSRPTKRELEYDANSSYKKYRDLLKEDFNGRCGYCDSYSGIVKKDYHIDHFVPQKLLEKFPTHIHLVNDYKNLIYSCPSCNRSKSNKWPSNHPDTTVVDGNGFVDPCTDEYDTLFYRNQDGAIKPIEGSITASYIYKELKLFFLKHQTTWKIEELMMLSKTAMTMENDEYKLELFSQLQNLLEEYFEME